MIKGAFIMIYRAGETIIFVAYYTANGKAKTGLDDVTGTIYKIGTPGSILAPSAIEQGDGFYYKEFTPTEDGIYVCIFKTADSTVDQKHIAGIAFRGVAGVNHIDEDISSRLASTDYTPPPTTSDIDNRLTTSHGAGSWQAYAVNALLLTIADDELTALVDNQSKKPISIFRGDSLDLDITVLDGDNEPIDLTGATAKFTARTHENSIDYVLEKNLDIYDPTNGKMKLVLDSTETNIDVKSYPADIEITFPDGKVKTVWKSTLEIKWDVGR